VSSEFKARASDGPEGRLKGRSVSEPRCGFYIPWVLSGNVRGLVLSSYVDSTHLLTKSILPHVGF
jgi:hypothetical protein